MLHLTGEMAAQAKQTYTYNTAEHVSNTNDYDTNKYAQIFLTNSYIRWIMVRCFTTNKSASNCPYQPSNTVLHPLPHAPAAAPPYCSYRPAPHT